MHWEVPALSIWGCSDSKEWCFQIRAGIHLKALCLEISLHAIKRLMLEDLPLTMQWRLPSDFQTVTKVTFCQMYVWLPLKCYRELPMQFVHRVSLFCFPMC